MERFQTRVFNSGCFEGLEKDFAKKMTEKYKIGKVSTDLQHVWGIVEWFHWSKEVNDILKKDLDNSQRLFDEAYDSINWDKYYEQLKGTIFYNWAIKMDYGFIDFGAPSHILEGRCFSTYGDISITEEDWLISHPAFNQVLHDIHVEIAEQMIDYILGHAAQVNYHDI